MIISLYLVAWQGGLRRCFKAHSLRRPGFEYHRYQAEFFAVYANFHGFRLSFKRVSEVFTSSQVRINHAVYSFTCSITQAGEKLKTTARWSTVLHAV